MHCYKECIRKVLYTLYIAVIACVCVCVGLLKETLSTLIIFDRELMSSLQTVRGINVCDQTCYILSVCVFILFLELITVFPTLWLWYQLNTVWCRHLVITCWSVIC
jgi:sterol desaturase/sphingolipid hydroxylase (fatty acid hydroxylase superfamily)